MSELSAPKLKSFKPGEVVFNEGDIGTKTYIVKTGSVKIIAQYDDKSVTLGVLKNGACFGEMAVIAQAPRVASAICEVHSEIYVIDKGHIDKMMSEMSPLFRAIVLSLIKRVKGLNAFAAEKASFTHPMVSVAHLVEMMSKHELDQKVTGNSYSSNATETDAKNSVEDEILLKNLVQKLKDILGYTEHGAKKILEKFVKLRLAKIESFERKQYFIFNPVDFIKNTKEVLGYLDYRGIDGPTAELEYVDLAELATQLEILPQRLLDAIYNGRISPDAILMRRHVVMESIESQGRQMF